MTRTSQTSRVPAFGATVRVGPTTFTFASFGRRTALAFAVGASFVLLRPAVDARAGVIQQPSGVTVGQACRVARSKLICPRRRGERLRTILRRFASPATTQVLLARANDYSDLSSPLQRERWRASVEINNRRSIIDLVRADRSLRHGLISPEQYRERLALHRAAFRNYRLAIERYQRAQWFADDEPAETPALENLPVS